jgi:glutamate carboxypeptidase
MPSLDATARALRDHLDRRRPQMIELLQHWVEIESPSLDKSRVDAFGAVVAEEFRRAGGDVHVIPDGCFGEHLKILFGATEERAPLGRLAGQNPRGRGSLLLLGHLDTVYPEGTLAGTPFRIADGRAWGPGTLDMKGGIVALLFALNALRELGLNPARPVVAMLASDEEIGSPGSRIITEGLANRAAVALVLEPAAGLQGALKTARKGIADFEISATGVAAHAGVDFEKGASAIVELARQIDRLAKLVDLERGITVNPGVISGGTRTNVVASEARVELDVRTRTQADMLEIERKIRSLEPFDPRVRLAIGGGLNRPPMERTAAIAMLFQQARDYGRRLGMDFEESATGGGSDGNFTAALGVPTLDGLGMVGEGAHSPQESILLDAVVPRTALLAMLIATL